MPCLVDTKKDAMSDVETAVPETSAEEPGQPAPQLDDPGKRALDAERRARREAEKAHKEASAELENLRKQFMTDQERAVVEAKEAGRTEALTAMGGKLVEAEFRVAAAGRVPTETLNRILGAIDVKPFVDQDGQPNSKAIIEFIEGIAPAEREPDPLDLGQGSRGQPHALNSDPLLRDLKNHLGIR